MRITSLIAFLFLFINAPILAQQDDDDLLLNIPAIVASQAGGITAEEGIAAVSKLAGRFQFSYIFNEDPDQEIQTKYYRFDPSTASATQSPDVFTIDGQGSLFNDFFGDWCNGGFLATFNAEVSDTNAAYLVFCFWGLSDDPNLNSPFGSLYFFQEPTDSLFSISHTFYNFDTNQIIVSESGPDTGTAFRISASFKGESLNPGQRSKEINQRKAQYLAQIERAQSELSQKQVLSKEDKAKQKHIDSALKIWRQRQAD